MEGTSVAGVGQTPAPVAVRSSSASPNAERTTGHSASRGATGPSSLRSVRDLPDHLPTRSSTRLRQARSAAARRSLRGRRISALLFLVALLVPDLPAGSAQAESPQNPTYEIAAPGVWVYLWGHTGDPWTSHYISNGSFVYDRQVQLWIWNGDLTPVLLNVSVVQYLLHPFTYTDVNVTGSGMNRTWRNETLTAELEQIVGTSNTTVYAVPGWSEPEVAIPEWNGTLQSDAAHVQLVVGVGRVFVWEIRPSPIGGGIAVRVPATFNATWELTHMTPSTSVILTDMTWGDFVGLASLAVAEGVILTLVYLLIAAGLRQLGGRIPLTRWSHAWFASFLLIPPFVYLVLFVPANQLLGPLVPWLVAPWLVTPVFPYMGLVFNRGHCYASLFWGFRRIGDRQGSYPGAVYHTGYFRGIMRALPETWPEFRYSAFHRGRMPALPAFKRTRRYKGGTREIVAMIEKTNTLSEDPSWGHRVPFADVYWTRPEPSGEKPCISRTYAHKARGMRDSWWRSTITTEADGSTTKVPLQVRAFTRSWVAPTLTFTPGHSYEAGTFASGLEAAHMRGEDIALYHSEALELRAAHRRERDYRTDDKVDSFLDALDGATDELSDEEAEEIAQTGWDEVKKTTVRERPPGDAAGSSGKAKDAS